MLLLFRLSQLAGPAPSGTAVSAETAIVTSTTADTSADLPRILYLLRSAVPTYRIWVCWANRTVQAGDSSEWG